MTSVQVAKPTKPQRQHLAGMLGWCLPVARIRRWTDRLGLNHSLQTEIIKINQTLLDLSKQGGPIHPGAPPKHPSKDASEADVAAYNTAVAQRKIALDLWKDYESPKHIEVRSAYQFYKWAHRLTEILYRTEPSDKSNEEKAILLTLLDDKPHPRIKKETDEHYKTRIDKFVPLGVKKYTAQVDLTLPNAITAFINKLRTDIPELNLFLTKDEISHKKVRFDGEGLITITAACEYIVNECVKHAMRNATDDGKRIIKPDHIIMGDGIFESAFYALFRNLPHFVALNDRHDRRTQHDTQTKEKRAILYRDARAKARSENRQYKKTDAPDLTILKSFEDEETDRGFAVRQEQTLPKKRGATVAEVVKVYLWKGIDIDTEEDITDSTNFNHYVNAVCKHVRDSVFPDKSVAESIKVSKSIKQFMSKMITDFLARLAPKFRILLEYNNVKTVDKNTVMTTIRMILSDNYIKREGNISWSKQHEAFFAAVQTSVDTWKTMSASGKEETEDADLDPLGDELADEEEDDEEEHHDIAAPAAPAAPATPAPHIAPAATLAATPLPAAPAARSRNIRRR